MNILTIEQKRDFVKENINNLPQAALDNYSSSFEIEYTHNSTAIEGNTLTLMETKLLLEDKLSVGEKYLREIYEVVNHQKAFKYVQSKIAEGTNLDETIIKDIHALLMDNIMIGGIYRNVEVMITGAKHTPPSPSEMYNKIKDFYVDLKANRDMEPIRFAAWTHAEFVKIHPFIDGNGRASRLIMNYQLMANNYLPVSIPKERRFEYYDCLEAYAVERNISLFCDFIKALEEERLDYYIEAIEYSIGE